MRRLTLTVALLLILALSATTLSACNERATTTAGQMWVSRSTLAALPTSGAAWELIRSSAYEGWAAPSLSDGNARNDTSTLAGALVAARTGDAALAAKTRASIMAVTRTTQYDAVLQLARNITSYVIAADVIGLPASDAATFRNFISGIRYRSLQGHSGGNSLYLTALQSPANWGTMARAAMAAIDIYLGDRNQLALVGQAHRAWLGERVPNSLRYSETAWHANPGDRTGINRRGSRVYGLDVDGVLPEDQRRSGEPSTSPAAEGSYPWEALQGALVAGVLLDRAGVVSINAGDSALARAQNWLFGTNANPPWNDDRWQPWVLNRVAGSNFPTVYSREPGKNMGFGDWTHGPTR